MIYGGLDDKEQAIGGVAYLIQKNKSQDIRKWKHINERILLVEVGRQKEIMTIIVAYKPREGDTQLDKGRVWNSLHNL